MDETQLLLWRWSTILQLTSLAMVAAFFAMLAHANPRAELRWWARAWGANLIALAATSIHWLSQSEPLFPVIVLFYFAGKTAFAALLAQGTWTMIRPGTRLFTTRILTIALAVVLWRSDAVGVTWLIAGIGVRGALALGEAAAYILQWQRPWQGPFAAWVEPAGTFLAASSSLDMAAEWLIVLGSMLALSERGRQALEASHHRLVLAQDDLRQLADRDPLTGAVNRRALRDIFNEVRHSGAMLLFFDLDGFKQINDVHGHAAGDDCLRTFANALKDSFRPGDHVVRYGGDEFLVIARGIDTVAARARVDDVDQRMKRHSGAIWCGFSVGMTQLEPGGSPEQALQVADQNMYKAKNRDRR